VIIELLKSDKNLISSLLLPSVGKVNCSALFGSSFFHILKNLMCCSIKKENSSV